MGHFRPLVLFALESSSKLDYFLFESLQRTISPRIFEKRESRPSIEEPGFIEPANIAGPSTNRSQDFCGSLRVFK